MKSSPASLWGCGYEMFSRRRRTVASSEGQGDRNNWQTPFSADTRLRVRLCRMLARVRGFTLLELLVVIVMIAILATLVAPNVFRHMGAAKERKGVTTIEEVLRV